MAFSKEQRRAVVAKIVANSSEFSEDTLAKLTDNQLVALAEPAKLDAMVANAKGKGNTMPNDTANVDDEEGVVNESEEDTDDDDAEEPKKPPFVKNKGGNYGKDKTANSFQDWMRSAPPHVQRMVANAQRHEKAQRQRLIESITANASCPLRPEDLARRSTEDLEAFAAMAQSSQAFVGNSQEEPEDFYDFSGAAGGFTGNSSRLEPLGLPTADYMNSAE